MKPMITAAIAYAAGADAGNRSMSKAGRSAWNDDDFDIACDEYNRLMAYCLTVSPVIGMSPMLNSPSPSRT